MKVILYLFLFAAFSAVAGEAVLVSTQPAAQLLFHPERSVPAEVVPLNDARLSAEINARVLEIAVRVGDRVSAGDQLVRLDCRDYQSRMDAQSATRRALESRIKLAQAQLSRAQDLKKQRNVSLEEVDQRETDLLTLRAELAAHTEAETQAELNLSRCEVKAPFNAVVSERLASLGALAAPGTPLLRLVQLDGAEVSAKVPPSIAAEGARADSLYFSYLDERFPVKVSRVLDVVDPMTRTVEVRLGFTEEMAPPGASGRVHWLSASAYVPADLLVRRDDKLGVFLYEEGRARLHPLAGAREGQPAAADLPDDALLIVEGRHRLQDAMAAKQSPIPESGGQL